MTGAPNPSPSPWRQPVERNAVALLVIDMQVDFCASGGWVDQLGEDIANTRDVIAPVRRVLAAVRAAGLRVVHTREGHAPDLSDLHPHKQWRTRVHGLGIGDTGAMGRVLVRGEPGWQIVPALAPLAGETVIDKPGKDAFHATDLDAQLRAGGVRHLVLTGVTSDCCVQSTLREATDLGYDALLLADCCAAVETGNHLGMLDLLSAWGGRFGTVGKADDFIGWLEGRQASAA